MRELKVEEFINLKQDNMSVAECSLNYSSLSKYAPSLVSYPRDEINRFVTGMANLVRKECRTTMIHDDMTLARLIAYAQLI